MAVQAQTKTRRLSRLETIALTLSEKHLAHAGCRVWILRQENGRCGYRTITDEAELLSLGFPLSQCRVPGLLLPLHTTDGTLGPPIYRPDSPRVVENKRKRLADGTHPQRVIKYEQPKGEPVRVDCPPMCQPRLVDPGRAAFYH